MFLLAVDRNKGATVTDIQKLRRLIAAAARRKRPMDAEEHAALSAVKEQLAALVRADRLDRIAARRFGEPSK